MAALPVKVGRFLCLSFCGMKVCPYLYKNFTRNILENIKVIENHTIRCGLLFLHSKCRKYYSEVKERKHIIGIKVNKGNFTATLIRFNQNLNYEKIYVFQVQI